MTEPWQLYVCWGLLVGAGTGAVAPVLAATIANRWFAKRRGLVLGLLTAGSSTGQLLFLPFLASLAGTTEWRRAALAVAVSSLLVVPLSIVFLRERPADLGHRPYGALEDDASFELRRAADRDGVPACCASRPAPASSGCWPAASSSAAPRRTG